MSRLSAFESAFDNALELDKISRNLSQQNPAGFGRQGWEKAKQAADYTTAWAKDQAETAARTLGRGARGAGNMLASAPQPIKTAGATTLGAGTLLAAGTLGYSAFNMLSGRSPLDGPNMPGSPEAKDAAARQQAQDQLNRYAQLAQETQAKSGEMAKIADEMKFMAAQDLQVAEAQQNMLLGMEQKRMDAVIENERKMQPFYSASRLRESMPEMSAQSYNFINNLIASRGSMR